MAGGLDNLSPDEFRQLSRTISEAKELIKQQEELLRKTMEMEQQIIGIKVAGLKEYNDEYSKWLNKMSSGQSDLNAMMAHLVSNTKEAADAADKAAKNASRADGGSVGGSSKPPSNGGGRNIRQNADDDKVGDLGTADSAAAENASERFKTYNSAADQLNAIYDDQKNAVVTLTELEHARSEQRKKQQDAYKDKEQELFNSQMSLLLLMDEANENSAAGREAREVRLRDIEISHMNEVSEAERKAQELRNQIDAELAVNAKDNGEAQARLINAQNNAKMLNELQKQMDKERAELEYQARLKNNGQLDALAIVAINEQLREKYDTEEKRQAEIEKLQEKAWQEERKNKEKERKEQEKEDKLKYARQRAEMRSDLNTMYTAETFAERKMALYNITHDENGDRDVGKAISATLLAVSDIVKQLESQIDSIASNKSAVDTRLQGSSNKTYSGSYWDQIVKDMTRVGAVNPYFKQEDFANKIKELVDVGIAFDLEQRAFLATISSKIATTFEATDGTLLRLIRIQQQDSTAGRLGMEAALNAFLNEMYENTEYLKTVADGVRNSLLEMQSLMEGAEAAEVEYQVQKWLGSLYSVGMSQEAVNSISSAIGQIAAGQIEGLTGGGSGNLLVMAASDAGLSIADILTEGLDSSNTNKLMQAVVNYLAEIAESSKGNNVVQQQLASVFGVKASDLRAATNLATKDSVSAIYGSSMTYDNMLYYLNTMAGSMGDRTSMAEKMTNIWNNVQYTLAGSIASTPIAYGLLKMGSLLDSAIGGIDLPFVNVMGFGVDLNTTVSELMRVGALSGGILGSIGALSSGLGNSFSGQKMLAELGISGGTNLAVTPRGDGSNLLAGNGGTSTSSSGYVGNSSASDIQESTIQGSKDSKKKQMVEAKEEEEANQVNILNETVIKIYELLEDVTHGNSHFRVKVDGWGLTGTGSKGSQGGVSALNDNVLSNHSTSSSYSTSTALVGSGVNAGGAGSVVEFGGWTTVL